MSSHILLLLGAIVGSQALFPDNYILEVTPLCGNGLQDNPAVAIKTDLKIRARADCANGVFEFTNLNNDTVNFDLPLAFPNTDLSKCQFVKRKDAHVYVVKVIVSYGEQGRMVSQDDEEMTITCTYDPHTDDDSDSQNIDNPLIAATELQYYKGVYATNSTLTLLLTNVIGEDITGQQIDLGRKVQLKAESDGGSGEVGLRPIACNAIGEVSGKKYAILRGGCGDGIIFTKTQGFTISGLITRSPYFPTFHLQDDVDFSFECNFTLCKENCDGSSCASERRRRASFTLTDELEVPKREVLVSTHHVWLEAPPVHVVDPKTLSRKRRAKTQRRHHRNLARHHVQK